MNPSRSTSDYASTPTPEVNVVEMVNINSVAPAVKGKRLITIKKTQLLKTTSNGNIIKCNGKATNIWRGISPGNRLNISNINTRALEVPGISGATPVTFADPIKRIQIGQKLNNIPLQAIVKLCKSSYNLNRTVLSDSVESFLGRKNVITLMSALQTVPDEHLRRQAIAVLTNCNRILADSSSQTELVNSHSVKVQTGKELDSCTKIFTSKTSQRKKHRRKIPFVRSDVEGLQAITTKKHSTEIPAIEEEIAMLSVSDSEISNNDSSSDTILSLSMLKSEDDSSLISNVKQCSEFEISKLGDVPLQQTVEYFQSCEDTMSNKTLTQGELLTIVQAFRKSISACLSYDSEGCLPLHDAARRDDFVQLKAQLEIYNRLSFSIDLPDKEGRSALQWALFVAAELPIIDALLENGANPLMLDSEDSTALHYCAQLEDPAYTKKIVDYLHRNAVSLLESVSEANKAKLFQDSKCKNMNPLQQLLTLAFTFPNGNDLSPLMMAAQKGRAENIKSMLSSCRIVESSLSTPGDSVEKVSDWVKMIVNSTDFNTGNTALHIAVITGITHSSVTIAMPEHYVRCIDVLMHHGANPHLKSYKNVTILDLVAMLPIKTNLQSLMPYINVNVIKLERNCSDESDHDVVIEPEPKRKKSMRVYLEIPQKSVTLNVKSTLTRGRRLVKVPKRFSPVSFSYHRSRQYSSGSDSM